MINSSDDLTNELYEHGFYDHTIKLPFKIPFIGDEIRTGILESFQLVEGAVTNISTGTQRVYIMQGINEMLKEGLARELARETSLKVIQPSSKVYIVDLIPSWLSSFRISLNELIVSILFSTGMLFLYFILSFFVF
ncbi:hypothetical protein BPT24_106 [Tenacibaculum phage pT24]|uniref:Uncharacterized protein n=1 Tax=Tenacibaculum phage pT24 TaxID=1880590 RepID=A0A1W7GKP9_9CAUD|nr:hypothetical protein HYP10_gp106 [Tenacibaculum phage pT24]BAX25554.1 hypothetical protein BPT24_106 [Tenacibaculum phage pT24]